MSFLSLTKQRPIYQMLKRSFFAGINGWDTSALNECNLYFDPVCSVILKLLVDFTLLPVRSPIHPNVPRVNLGSRLVDQPLDEQLQLCVIEVVFFARAISYLDNVSLLIILFAVPRVASFRLAGRPVLLSVYIAVDVSSLIILRGLSMWSIRRHCPPTTL